MTVTLFYSIQKSLCAKFGGEKKDYKKNLGLSDDGNGIK